MQIIFKALVLSGKPETSDEARLIFYSFKIGSMPHKKINIILVTTSVIQIDRQRNNAVNFQALIYSVAYKKISCTLLSAGNQQFKSTDTESLIVQSVSIHLFQSL